MTKDQVNVIFNQPFKTKLMQRESVYESVIIAITGFSYRKGYVVANATVLRSNFPYKCILKYERLNIENGNLVYNNQ